MKRRFEVKYYVHQLQCAPLVRDLRGFMDYDSHAVAEHGRYFIRSLYLDTPGYEAFHEKLAGLRTRTKYRFRTYHDGHGAFGPVGLEIKGRLDQTVTKQRAGVDPSSYQWMIRGGPFPDELPPSPVVRQLVRAVRHDHLRPVSLVEYRRQAFFGRTDHRVRVTFDDRLRTARGRDLFQSDISWRRPFDPHVVVLEIKVDESLPYWLQKIIHKYQLKVTAVSKYCLGVAAGALR